MLRFLGKAFAKCLSAIAWIIVILGPVCGFGVWSYMQKNYYFENAAMGMAVLFILCIVGFLIAFTFDIVVFGFLSQIISIRESIDRIEEKLDSTE